MREEALLGLTFFCMKLCYRLRCLSTSIYCLVCRIRPRISWKPRICIGKGLPSHALRLSGYAKVRHVGQIDRAGMGNHSHDIEDSRRESSLAQASSYCYRLTRPPIRSLTDANSTKGYQINRHQRCEMQSSARQHKHQDQDQSLFTSLYPLWAPRFLPSPTTTGIRSPTLKQTNSSPEPPSSSMT